MGSATLAQASTLSHKGKGREMGDKVTITANHLTILTLENEGESEVDEVGQLMGDDDEEENPVHGQSMKQGRSQLSTCQSNTWGHSHSQAQKDDREEGSGAGADEPPAKKKCHAPATVDDTPHPSEASTNIKKTQPFSIIIPAPKHASSYTIPPLCHTEALGSTPVRAVSAEYQAQAMPPSAPTPEWLPPISTPGIPKLLWWVNAMTDRQDLILAQVQGMMGAEFDGSISLHVEKQQDVCTSLHEGMTSEPTDSMHPNQVATTQMSTMTQEQQGPMIEPMIEPVIESAEWVSVGAAPFEPLGTVATHPCEPLVMVAIPESEMLATVATPLSQPLEVVATTEMEVCTSNAKVGGHSQAGNGNGTLD
ncbi:hypothetical protein PISMIDRAFT_23201 [Pisolithus microcarpus 441]|uniref:Uncharacterized protein n=1 Tax=Pisolithus microcarpus 441 TaxID=765257 RepID=A0A0C9Z576_9AGAM|nr:hypothetical protein BKA83DRAFT_23201 [Pisolithus microcarpus]KIK24276.1 hypothetical protein PISMIDRAFT_23201 [Pisolithus microcarpus 441]